LVLRCHQVGPIATCRSAGLTGLEQLDMQIKHG
jgi:hypothetical protein